MPNQHLTQLTHAAAILAKHQKRFNDIGKITELQQQFEAKLERFKADEQQLNIAVMGQVKAGKSSFLNALLFGGKKVLPAAATPKTANLTRISYGEQPALHIEFYQPDEWADIVKLAATPDDNSEVLVAKELVKLVQDSGVNVSQTLQEGTRKLNAENLDDLMALLNDYTGNDGKYTALVKMTHLYLPREELKGFDIVDTPGMNDPVVSRTQKTKQEMQRSDVVFFLSRSSQFLDESDMHLLANQLPEAGVKRMVLVATQLDAAILDDGWNSETLATCEANLNKRLNNRAKTEMEKLAKNREEAGRPENAQLTRQLVHPIVSSTYAQGFSTMPPEHWGKDMQHVYEKLTELGTDDWNGFIFTQDDWIRLANFQALREAYTQARADKKALLEQQKQAILPEAKQKLTATLNDLSGQVADLIVTLKTGDLSELKQQEKACEKRIDLISGKLEALLDEYLSSMQQEKLKIVQSLNASMRDYDTLQTRTGTEYEERARSRSTSTWYKPWTWGSSETYYETVAVNYEYVSASDAVEKLRNYQRSCEIDIEQSFNAMLNPLELKNRLKRTLLDALDTSSTDFNPQQFRAILEESLRGLNIEPLTLQGSDPTMALSQQFSGQVRNQNDINALRQTFAQALKTIYGLVRSEFEVRVSRLEDDLKRTQATLRANLTADMHAELAKLQQDFAQKQTVLNDYEDLKTTLETLKSA